MKSAQLTSESASINCLTVKNNQAGMFTASRGFQKHDFFFLFWYFEEIAVGFGTDLGRLQKECALFLFWQTRPMQEKKTRVPCSMRISRPSVSTSCTPRG